MIRAAKAIDLPAIMSLLKEGFKNSRYADMGNIAEKPAEQLVLGMVLKHGIKAMDGTYCQVVTYDDKIIGIHFAALQRIQLIGDKLFATDVFFYVRKGHPFQAAALLDRFEKWAWSNPKVIEIQPGVINLMQDYKIAGRFYEKCGYEQVGAIYRKEKLETGGCHLERP